MSLSVLKGLVQALITVSQFHLHIKTGGGDHGSSFDWRFFSPWILFVLFLLLLQHWLFTHKMLVHPQPNLLRTPAPESPALIQFVQSPCLLLVQN